MLWWNVLCHSQHPGQHQLTDYIALSLTNVSQRTWTCLSISSPHLPLVSFAAEEVGHGLYHQLGSCNLYSSADHARLQSCMGTLFETTLQPLTRSCRSEPLLVSSRGPDIIHTAFCVCLFSSYRSFRAQQRHFIMMTTSLAEPYQNLCASSLAL